MTRDFYMDKVRKGTQNIKRFQMEDVIKPQSLAEHGYHVVNLFLIACNFTGYSPSVKELDKVINHDVLETLTGDLNKRIKDFSKETIQAWAVIEESVLDERWETEAYSDSFEGWEAKFISLLEFCDSMEAYLYCTEEYKRGNHNLGRALEYYHSRLRLMNSNLFSYIVGD